MTRDGTVGRFRRNRAKPGVSSGHRSRLNDEDSVRGPHQGQQSTRTAPTGRTHDCKRPLRCTPNDLLPGGGHPHMKRREFIMLLGGAAATWPLAARAQQPDRMRRIGVLMSGAATATTSQSYVAMFVEALRQLGWTEGQNVRVNIRWNAGDAQLTRIYAAQLIGLMPDVILAATTANLEAIQQATSTVPVVFTQVSDPVAQGFVASVAKPGGNLTGFSAYEFSIGGKWLELLKEIAPGLARIGVMFNPDTSPQSKFFMRSI